MSDERLRELGRRAAIGGIPDQARHIDEILRVQGETAVVQTLSRMQNTSRAAVLALTNIEQQRRPILELVSQLDITSAFDGLAPYEINSEKGDAALPPEQAVLQSILNQLTLEQAREILSNFQEPTLVVVPKTITARHLRAARAASQTMEGSQEPRILDFFRTLLDTQAEQAQIKSDGIKGYEWMIFEGKQLMDAPDHDLPLGQRVDDYDLRYPQESGIQRTDSSGIVAAIVKSLVEGKPMGCKYEGDSRKSDAEYNVNAGRGTISNERDEERGEESGLVGAGGWDPVNRRVILGEGLTYYRFEYPEFRSAVKGDIVL